MIIFTKNRQHKSLKALLTIYELSGYARQETRVREHVDFVDILWFPLKLKENSNAIYILAISIWRH